MPYLLVALTLSRPPPAAPPERANYLIVFAGDHTPYRPTQAHTFAALVGVETPPGGPPRVVELHSISWLPETMNVRGLALRPEKGRNVPLDETLAYCLGPRGHVTAWGPYLVRPDLAATFRARVATVEGQFRYKGACFTSRRAVCDCARSIEEMARPDRRFIGAFGYGAAAESSVVRTFSPWLVEPHHTHPWVADLISLGAYPLVWRGYGEYTTKWDQFRAARRW